MVPRKAQGRNQCWMVCIGLTAATNRKTVFAKYILNISNSTNIITQTSHAVNQLSSRTAVQALHVDCLKNAPVGEMTCMVGWHRGPIEPTEERREQVDSKYDFLQALTHTQIRSQASSLVMQG